MYVSSSGDHEPDRWGGRDWTIITLLIILVVLAWLSVSEARGDVGQRKVLFHVVDATRDKVTLQPIIPETTVWSNLSEAPLATHAVISCRVGNDASLPNNPAVVECNGVQLRLLELRFTPQ